MPHRVAHRLSSFVCCLGQTWNDFVLGFINFSEIHLLGQKPYKNVFRKQPTLGWVLSRFRGRFACIHQHISPFLYFQVFRALDVHYITMDFVGSIVSVDCGDVLGTYQGQVVGVDSETQALTLTKVFQNGIQSKVPQVMIRYKKIAGFLCVLMSFMATTLCTMSCGTEPSIPVFHFNILNSNQHIYTVYITLALCTSSCSYLYVLPYLL